MWRQAQPLFHIYRAFTPTPASSKRQTIPANPSAEAASRAFLYCPSGTLKLSSLGPAWSKMQIISIAPTQKAVYKAFPNSPPWASISVPAFRSRRGSRVVRYLRFRLRGSQWPAKPRFAKNTSCISRNEEPSQLAFLQWIGSLDFSYGMTSNKKHSKTMETLQTASRRLRVLDFLRSYIL